MNNPKDKQDDKKDPPWLISVKTLTERCGIGETLAGELDKDGSLPEPIKLHSKKLWSARQIEYWCFLGCPARNSDIWQKMIDSIQKDPEKYL